MESLFTASITVVSGVSIYVFGEILRDVWLTPLIEFKRLRSEVVYTLTFFKMNLFDFIDLIQDGHKYFIQNEDAAVEEILRKGAQLRAFIETLSWFKIGIPSKKDLFCASVAMDNIAKIIVDEDFVPDEIDRYDYLEQQTELIYHSLRSYKG